MTPLFSIVMPSLNAGVYLERALQSVLSQAGADTEIIAVDGGSADGSVEIIRSIVAAPLVQTACGLVQGVKNSSADGGRSVGVLKCESSKVCAEEQKKGVYDNFRTLELPNSRTLFHWCSEPDRGQSHALNKGFARATGKYLLWINADDLLLPGTLDRAREFLQTHPQCAWLAGNLVYIDGQDLSLIHI